MPTGLFSRTVRYAFPMLVIFIFWEGAVRLLNVPEFLLPAPSRVFVRIWQIKSILAPHLLTTFSEIAGGFLLGSIAAGLLSVLILSSRSVENFLYPLIVASQVVPKIAVAPLLILWFGYGVFPKIITAALIAFFPLVVNTVQGLKSVEPELVEFMSSLAATGGQVLFKVRLPSAVPFIFSALKISLVYSVVGAIVGEFIGSNKGLGFLIIQGDVSFDTPLIFASLVVLTFLGLLLFGLVSLLHHRIMRRYPSEQAIGAPFTM